MEDWVHRAVARWPNVPALYGWLALDRRGRWRIKGETISRPQIIDTLNRNYAADEHGRWFFQNGPQRVFVELQATPWIWRIASDGSLTTHTGQAAQYRRCLVDEQGHAYLEAQLTDPNTPDGPATTAFGLVHTLDVAQVADALAQGQWDVESVLSSELPARYGYVPSPQKRLADSLLKK